MAVVLYRVRTGFVGIPGTPYLSTMYFDLATGTAQDAADAVGNFWTDLAGVMSQDLDWNIEDQVASVDTATGNVFAFTTVAGGSGSPTDSGELLPIATQGLIEWGTGVVMGNRLIRGKTFIPGMTQTGNDSGFPISGLLTAMATAAANLIADTATVFEIYSKKNGVGESVTVGTPWTKYAVLKSRRD